jgi:hypothetical protein
LATPLNQAEDKLCGNLGDGLKAAYRGG